MPGAKKSELAVGFLTYDSAFTVEFDDRVLAHLQVVIGAKLRRGEAFYFSWKGDDRSGEGRTTIWIHPSLALQYRYTADSMPLLNRQWVEALTVSANSAGGLLLVPEPAEVKAPEPASAQKASARA